MKDTVIEYLKNKQPKLCVLSTVSPENTSEAAVVGYAVTDDGNILISTKPETRKWKNITTNPHVALVVGWSFEELNIQCEGTARQITKDDPDYEQTDSFFFTQNPHAKAFRTPETVFTEITLSWIRKLDPTKPRQMSKKYVYSPFTSLKIS